MITIGSKSSVSYLSPISKWDWINAFFTRSQSVDIERQYQDYNIRFFDICVRIEDDKHTVFCYSDVSYQTFSVYEIFSFLNSRGGCTVRLTLEDQTVNPISEHKFYLYCVNAEMMYPNIDFCGGYAVSSPSYKIYHFNYEKKCQRKFRYISALPEDSGFFKKMLYYIFPKLYARFYNKKLIEKYSEEQAVLLLNYIQFVN